MVDDPLLDRRVRGQVVIPIEHLSCKRRTLNEHHGQMRPIEEVQTASDTPNRFRAVSRSSSGNLQWSAYKSNIFSRTRRISFAWITFRSTLCLSHTSLWAGSRSRGGC